MDTSYESILIIVPTLTISTSIFDYFYNSFRSENITISFKGFFAMLGASIIYAVLLSIFVYFLYNLVIENFYKTVKTYVMIDPKTKREKTVKIKPKETSKNKIIPV